MEVATDEGEVSRYYSDLMYVRYDAPHCWLHFICGAKYRVEVSLTWLLAHLPELPFFKCNRAEIINICYYKEYRKNPPMVILENDVTFELSVRNIYDFKKRKNNLQCISPPCAVCVVCEDHNCSENLFCLPTKSI